MDIDEPANSKGQGGSSSSTAAASSSLAASLAAPFFFAPVADGVLLERARVTGTEDLLAAFNLTGIYEDFVRPFVGPYSQTPYASAVKDTKGKGKALGDFGGNGVLGESQSARRKLPKGYNHLVQDMPGRYNNLHRDSYFRNLAENPEIQDIEIRPDALDDQMKHDAFALEPGGIAEELDTILGITQTVSQHKKKRKKRKRDDLDASTASLPAAESVLNGFHPPENQNNAGDPSKKKRKKGL